MTFVDRLNETRDSLDAYASDRSDDNFARMLAAFESLRESHNADVLLRSEARRERTRLAKAAQPAPRGHMGKLANADDSFCDSGFCWCSQ